MSVSVMAGVAQGLFPLGVLATLSALSAGCVKVLPPAATPQPVAPAVAVGHPPAAGHGRVVVDVVDGPTPVHRVHMEPRQIADGQGRVRFRFFEVSELLCAASPCVADLPAGNVLLGFPVVGDENAIEVELVHVGPEPTVYRRALSYHGRGKAMRVLGIIGTALGGSATATGAVFLPLGLSRGSDAFTIAGATSLAAGAGLLTLGIIAINVYAPTYRVGSSIHFPLPGPGAGLRGQPGQ
jgi:hypothetical protein